MMCSGIRWTCCALVALLTIARTSAQQGDDASLQKTIEDMRAQIVALQQARREDRSLLYSVLNALPSPPPSDVDQMTAFDDLMLRLTSDHPARAHKAPPAVATRTIRALERERQSLEKLESQLEELKRDLSEMVQVKEGQLGLKSELGDLRLDIEALRGSLRHVEQGVEGLRSRREDDAALLSQVRVHHTTIKWLQKSVEEVRSEMSELASALNTSVALRQRQQFESSVQLVRTDFASLRRDMELMRAMVEKDKAAVVQTQQDVQDVRRMCQQFAVGLQHLAQEIASVRDDVTSAHLHAATSTLTAQPVMQSGESTSEERTNHVDEIVSSGEGEATEMGVHEDDQLLHRFRHHGRMRMDVERTKKAVVGLHDTQARLEKELAKLKQNLSTVYADTLHAEHVVQRLSNRTSELEARESLAANDLSDIKERLHRLEALNEKQSNAIRNVSDVVGSVDKLHTSTLQLFEALEALESKFGKNIADMQKDVSKFDFNMAQMQSTLDILREDQSSNLAGLKAVKKEQSLMKLEIQKDHYQLMAVKNEVLNRSLQECRQSNAEMLHDVKLTSLSLAFNRLVSKVEGHKKELDSFHVKLKNKADDSELQRLEDKERLLDERLRNVSSEIPVLEDRIQHVQKQIGKFERRLPIDCSMANDVSPPTAYKSGVYLIRPTGMDRAVEVYCDMDTDGGQWTVIQRRQDGSEDFYRDWDEYAEGFGHQEGEYWLGNEAIHLLTAQGNYTLRLDMWDTSGQHKYAEYEHFFVAGEEDDYRLSLGGYRGNASDAMYYHNQMAFSTRDRDNDASSTHCATYYSSGWWYNHCQYVNINGRYNIGLTWYDIDSHEWVQLTKVEMKIRTTA